MLVRIDLVNMSMWFAVKLLIFLCVRDIHIKCFFGYLRK